MPKKYLEPKVFLTCHFCGHHLPYEVTVDTYKIWQAKVHPCVECLKRQPKEGIKLDLTEVSACCSNPPGDGSTCAGGTCQCEDDYECDKCKSPIFKKTPQGGWAGEI
ncbi:MAG: hypothetical protein GWN31_13065 [Candidatus Thorarchaeota archaeon]|nr:hypothetical protein [Candidatus Thorarchaeota archaeon]NIW52877.1 hypothetical protein [Candidatus Korarchaeota archaeon]